MPRQLFTVVDGLSKVPSAQRDEARALISHAMDSELSETHYRTMHSRGKPGVRFKSSTDSKARTGNVPSWRIATRDLRSRQQRGEFAEGQPLTDGLVKTIAPFTASAIYNHDLLDENGMGLHNDERARHENFLYWCTFRPAGSTAFVHGNVSTVSHEHECKRIPSDDGKTTYKCSHPAHNKKPWSYAGAAVVTECAPWTLTVMHRSVNSGMTAVSADGQIREGQALASHGAFALSKPLPAMYGLTDGKSLTALVAEQPAGTHSHALMFGVESYSELAQLIAALEAYGADVAKRSMDMQLPARALPSPYLWRDPQRSRAMFDLCVDGTHVTATTEDCARGGRSLSSQLKPLCLFLAPRPLAQSLSFTPHAQCLSFISLL